MSMSSAPRPAQFGLWPSENKKEKSVANPRNKDLISEDDEEEEVVVLGYESSASDDETEPELDEAAKEEAAKKAAAEKAKEKPMRAALVQLVSKYDKKAGTNKTYKMSSTRDPTAGDDGKKDKYAHYALSTTLVFNANGRLTRKILEIKAPVLKDVCQTVIGNKFPGMNFKTPRVGINCPPRALFFYRHEFAEQKRLWEKRLEELKVLEDAKSEAEKAADREKAAAEAEAQRVADDAEKAAAAEFDDTDKNGKKKASAAARKTKTLEEKTYAELADDIEYLRLFLRFIQNELRDEIGIYESLTPQGLISYDTLWTIFPPDTLFLTHTHNSEPCLLRLGKGVTVTEGTDLGFFLDAFAVDYDGFNFGYVQASAVIPPFEGTMEIANLPAIPLAFLPDAEKVLADLTARGRLSEKLQAGAGAGRPSYMGYKGAALGPVVDRRRVQYTIAGRVMVDPTTFFRKNPERAINVRSLTSRKAAHAFEMLGYETTCTCSSCRESDAFEDGVDGLKVDADLAITNHDPEERTHRTGQFYRPLTDPEAALVTPFVRGFALAEKKWCEFAVSKLTEVAWVTDAFDKLVLPAAQKELILAMVEATPPGTSSTSLPPLLNPPTPTSETPLEFPRDSAEESGYTFDDFIPAKGLGLVAVFAGPPGLGKTAATEAVAEYTRRPLYAVTTGELGESAAELEEKLAEILDIASTWNAILLIDEADIFLEARDAAASSIARNAMVGIFLRLLEYFRGTMFLTTNRVSAFDAAFKSRIHLSLRFGPLARDARAQVWRNFVGAVPGELVAPELLGRDEQGLQGVERLADAYPGTNGRNIKNAVKTGLRIARRRGGKLDERVLRDVLGLGEAFDEEWRANASGL